MTVLKGRFHKGVEGTFFCSLSTGRARRQFSETKTYILQSGFSSAINKSITPVKNKKKLEAFEICPVHSQSTI